MSSYTLIVAGAPVSDPSCYSAIIDSALYIVAVDVGADLCLAHGRTPDLVVGDMDSLSAQGLCAIEQADVRILTYARDKDFSDLDGALSWCDEHKDDSLVVTAVTGGRIDHEIAALGSLARFAHCRPTVLEPDVEIRILSARGVGSHTLSDIGTVFSVIALDAPAQVSIAPARYPLEHATIQPLSSRGLSNVVDMRSCRVLVHTGTVALIIPVQVF